MALTSSCATGQGTFSVVGRDSPEASFKGIVTAVAPDGVSVSGRCVTRQGGHEWTFKPGGGFQYGKAIPRDSWNENPHAPKGRLDAWNAEYGWEAHAPGRSLGTHMAYFCYADGISDDGTVVIGDYGADNPSGSTNGEEMNQNIDGAMRDISVRTFLWKKGLGFCDLWDLAAGTQDVAPKTETDSNSSAVSGDGRSIAILTDRLFLLRAPHGFSFDKDRSSSSAPTTPSLRLTGVVQSVGKDGFILRVESVQAPDGTTTTLSPARPKKVLMSPAGPPPVAKGSRVTVTGTDSGPGTPLRGRTVILSQK